MILAQVVGTAVATQKHDGLNGYKLLVVQPLDRKLALAGTPLVAADVVGAGVGERVLVTLGCQARAALHGDAPVPVDAAVVGIVDQVEMTPDWAPQTGGSHAGR